MSEINVQLETEPIAVTMAATVKDVAIAASSPTGGVDITMMAGNGSVNMAEFGVDIKITEEDVYARRYAWLKGDGKSYFDTKYIPNANTWYECRAKYSAGNVPVFGSRLTDSATNVGLSIYGSYSYGFYYNHYEAMITPTAVPFVCKIAKNGDIYVDDVLRYNTSGEYMQRDLPLHIFGMNKDGNNVLPSSHYFFFLKVYENATLVHNYRPAADLDGRICLYDEVDHRFIYNNYYGAGIALTVGNE